MCGRDPWVGSITTIVGMLFWPCGGPFWLPSDPVTVSQSIYMLSLQLTSKESVLAGYMVRRACCKGRRYVRPVK